MRHNRPSGVWLARFCHIAAVCAALILAFLLRFDFSIPPSTVKALERSLMVAAVVKLFFLERFGVYRGVSRFASFADLRAVLLGNLAGSAAFVAIALLWIGPSLPRSILLIDAILCFLATACITFSRRIYSEAISHRFAEGRRILIYGAGAAGAELLHDIQSHRRAGFDVQGFIDDDPGKVGAFIHGVQVLGSGRQALLVLQDLKRRGRKVEEIVIAMPSATGAQMHQVLANCKAANISCKTIPGLDELLRGRISGAETRELSVHHLLGRQPVQLDELSVKASIADRTVLVTGAAGSIGSELCNQLARFDPACLIAFDQAESGLFRIQNELSEKFPKLRLVTALGDIRDPSRLNDLFMQRRVDSIFHAAAYKHVPLMESHILEAVRNNILGTWNLVRAAQQSNVHRLLLISSDKAVNPLCVMGATKRVCEKLVCANPQSMQTKGVAVRFGNVLGSSGSVVPIFREQIAAGGPLKVTHPDARRYFMTISEAVSLVVRASAQSQGDEIFVLDMGEPIRIVDLAEKMIRLAGFIPYQDIDIQFTGLRPGEKLIEQISSPESAPTSFQEKIQIIREEPSRWDLLSNWISELEQLVRERAEAPVLKHIQIVVPEYTPSNEFAWPRSESDRSDRQLSLLLPQSIAAKSNGRRKGVQLPPLPEGEYVPSGA